MDEAIQLSSASAVVVFVLVPRCEQHDIGAANREQDNTTAMAEGDDQLPELPVRVRSAAGVWREGEDSHRTLHRIPEPEEAGVIWRIARQLSLHDVLLKALDVLLEGERRYNSKTFAHPAVRLLLAAVASRIRC